MAALKETELTATTWTALSTGKNLFVFATQGDAVLTIVATGETPDASAPIISLDNGQSRNFGDLEIEGDLVFGKATSAGPKPKVSYREYTSKASGG